MTLTWEYRAQLKVLWWTHKRTFFDGRNKVFYGGLGIRLLLEISLPAYLYSVSCVKDFVSTETNIQNLDSDIAHLTEALMIWSDINNGTRIELVRWNRTFSFSTSPKQNVRLNFVYTKSIGTFLNNEVMHLCIGLQLGTIMSSLRLWLWYSCGIFRSSRSTLSTRSTHNSGRFFRHAELNRIIHQILSSINATSLLEPTLSNRWDRGLRKQWI